jgi:hypothetical protein
MHYPLMVNIILISRKAVMTPYPAAPENELCNQGTGFCQRNFAFSRCSLAVKGLAFSGLTFYCRNFA